MSYNSSHIDPRDVAVYKRMIDQIRVDSLTRDQQLAFAQALEERAIEIRQREMEVNEAAKNQIW